MNDNYVQGFIQKCSEAGVDPEELAKLAQSTDSRLWDYLASIALPVGGQAALGAVRGDEGQKGENALRSELAGWAGGLGGGIAGGLGGYALGGPLAQLIYSMRNPHTQNSYGRARAKGPGQAGGAAIGSVLGAIIGKSEAGRSQSTRKKDDKKDDKKKEEPEEDKSRKEDTETSES